MNPIYQRIYAASQGDPVSLCAPETFVQTMNQAREIFNEAAALIDANRNQNP